MSGMRHGETSLLAAEGSLIRFGGLEIVDVVPFDDGKLTSRCGTYTPSRGPQGLSSSP